MPDIYEIEGPGGTFEIESDHPPTPDEVLRAVRAHGDAVAAKEQARLTAGPEGSAAGRFVSNAASMLNPVAMVKGAYQAVRHPIDTATGVVSQMGEQWDKAQDRFEQGRYVEAAGHALAGSIPLVGPTAANVGEQIARGDVAGGVGATAGMLAPAAVMAAVRRPISVRVKPALRLKNAAEADALAFAQREGIPVDAGTATGNRFVRGVQALADNSPLGSVVAERSQASRAAALKATGDRLAARVSPSPVMPEQAGQAVRGAIQRQVSELHGAATRSYDRLREIEGQTLREVPKAPLAPEARKALQRNLGGRLPNDWVIRELRRIRAEMDAYGYEAGKLVQESLDESATHYSKGHGGAPVYHDVIKQMSGTDVPTRGDVLESIDRLLNYGDVDARARGALEVAKLRRGGNFQEISKPFLPPDAAEYASTETMAMPVKLTDVKSMLRPVYDRMTRQLPLTQQRSSPGLKAIENILNGPDYAPASQVDTDLSAIKAISREVDLPELRDMSQGLAATAVKRLEAAVKTAVEQGGKEAVDALETGRAATRAKYGAADVLKRVREEPVQAFQQAVYSKDAGIEQLRRVQELAPAEMPQVGRAFVEDLLATATQKGGFDKGATIYSKWKSLGPETRRILFSETSQDLDRFFLLAERLAEPANPSRTALVLNSGSQAMLVFTNPATGIPVVLGSGALAKVLHSPKAVKFLTQGMRLSVGPGKTSAAARASAVANALKAVREAGVDLSAVPALATEDDPAQRQEGRTPR